MRASDLMVKIGLREIEGMDWINVVKDIDWWWTVANTVMKLWVLYKVFVDRVYC